jgi:hypothetical protein
VREDLMGKGLLLGAGILGGAIAYTGSERVRTYVNHIVTRQPQSAEEYSTISTSASEYGSIPSGETEPESPIFGSDYLAPAGSDFTHPAGDPTRSLTPKQRKVREERERIRKEREKQLAEESQQAAAQPEEE